MAPSSRLLQGSIAGSSMTVADNRDLSFSNKMGFALVIKKLFTFEGLAGQLFAPVNNFIFPLFSNLLNITTPAAVEKHSIKEKDSTVLKAHQKTSRFRQACRSKLIA